MIRSRRLAGIGGTLALVVAASLGIPAWGADPSQPTGSFSLTGSLADARSLHSATLMLDGRILVAGGVTGDGSVRPHHADTELWDPITGIFGPAGSLIRTRDSHTATLLLDGRVLIVGGVGGTRRAGADDTHGLAADAELWDPATGTFAPTGSLAGPRFAHTATLLLDGRVLVVGGLGGDRLLDDAEVWDPATGAFTPAGRLSEARGWHTTTLLPDGRVLVVGGADLRFGTPIRGDAEVWDPSTGVFVPAGSLDEPRYDHSATWLVNGWVLTVGGAHPNGPGVSGSVEAWDPASGSFSPAGPLIEGRARHTSTLLPDGGLLVIGGQRRGVSDDPRLIPLASAELRDPVAGTFQPTGPLTVARSGHTATLLPDGRVIVIGGDGQPGYPGGAVASAELWTP